jgi:hypothetical protein
VLGAGRHRVSFAAAGHVTDVDVDVTPYRSVCIYRTLPR